MRNIRITRKCEICGAIMFWEVEEFHCSHCKISTAFSLETFAHYLHQGYVDVPEVKPTVGDS